MSTNSERAIRCNDYLLVFEDSKSTSIHSVFSLKPLIPLFQSIFNCELTVRDFRQTAHLTVSKVSKIARWKTYGKAKLRIRYVTLTSIDFNCLHSSPNPMFDHLLESSHRDDSYKWSNIGFGEEITHEVSIAYCRSANPLLVVSCYPCTKTRQLPLKAKRNLKRLAKHLTECQTVQFG